MQKKLIALAIASLAAPAFAQSNVSIYGSLDATFATMTNDGVGVGQNDVTHKTSRLGFKGSEDLGNGYKAFFQLEERFKLDTATADGDLRWKDKAWVGLEGGFGKVSFGRIPTALDIIYGGGKAGNVDTIADWNGRKAKATTRFDNGISYSSPKLGGMVTIHAATAFGDQAKERGFTKLDGTGNGTESTGGANAVRPYDIAANVSFGKAFVEAGYQASGSYGSDNAGKDAFYKSIIVNGGYNFGFMNLYAAFVQSKSYEKNGLGTDGIKYTQYEIGADVKAGANGKVYVTLGQSKGKDAAGDIKPANGGASAEKYTKLGVAYIHSLSKRTQLLAATSYAKQSEGFGGVNNLKDNQVGLQVGVRHAF